MPKRRKRRKTNFGASKEAHCKLADRELTAAVSQLKRLETGSCTIRAQALAEANFDYGFAVANYNHCNENDARTMSTTQAFRERADRATVKFARECIR
jgi:hypothetical protein